MPSKFTLIRDPDTSADPDNPMPLEDSVRGSLGEQGVKRAHEAAQRAVTERERNARRSERRAERRGPAWRRRDARNRRSDARKRARRRSLLSPTNRRAVGRENGRATQSAALKKIADLTAPPPPPTSSRPPLPKPRRGTSAYVFGRHGPKPLSIGSRADPDDASAGGKKKPSDSDRRKKRTVLGGQIKDGKAQTKKAIAAATQMIKGLKTEIKNTDDRDKKRQLEQEVKGLESTVDKLKDAGDTYHDAENKRVPGLIDGEDGAEAKTGEADKALAEATALLAFYAYLKQEVPSPPFFFPPMFGGLQLGEWALRMWRLWLQATGVVETVSSNITPEELPGPLLNLLGDLGVVPAGTDGSEPDVAAGCEHCKRPDSCPKPHKWVCTKTDRKEDPEKKKEKLKKKKKKKDGGGGGDPSGGGGNRTDGSVAGIDSGKTNSAQRASDESTETSEERIARVARDLLSRASSLDSAIADTIAATAGNAPNEAPSLSELARAVVKRSLQRLPENLQALFSDKLLRELTKRPEIRLRILRVLDDADRISLRDEWMVSELSELLERGREIDALEMAGLFAHELVTRSLKLEVAELEVAAEVLETVLESAGLPPARRLAAAYGANDDPLDRVLGAASLVKAGLSSRFGERSSGRAGELVTSALVNAVVEFSNAADGMPSLVADLLERSVDADLARRNLTRELTDRPLLNSLEDVDAAEISRFSATDRVAESDLLNAYGPGLHVPSDVARVLLDARAMRASNESAFNLQDEWDDLIGDLAADRNRTENDALVWAKITGRILLEIGSVAVGVGAGAWVTRQLAARLGSHVFARLAGWVVAESIPELAIGAFDELTSEDPDLQRFGRSVAIGMLFSAATLGTGKIAERSRLMFRKPRHPGQSARQGAVFEFLADAKLRVNAPPGAVLATSDIARPRLEHRYFEIGGDLYEVPARGFDNVTLRLGPDGVVRSPLGIIEMKGGLGEITETRIQGTGFRKSKVGDSRKREGPVEFDQRHFELGLRAVREPAFVGPDPTGGAVHLGEVLEALKDRALVDKQSRRLILIRREPASVSDSVRKLWQSQYGVVDEAFVSEKEILKWVIGGGRFKHSNLIDKKFADTVFGPAGF